MNKKIITSLISLLISAALIIIFAYPLWSSVKNLRQELAQEELALAEIEDLLNTTQELQQDLQELGEESQRIFLALPKEKDIPNLLIQFETLALTNGLLLESIKFGQIAKEETTGQETTQSTKKLNIRNLPVDLVASGSYSAFKKYLADLETNVRSMDVYSIGLAPPGPEEGINLLSPSFSIFEIKIGLVVYYQ